MSDHLTKVTSDQQPMTVRGFARRRGVSHSAVSKAIKMGRLSACVRIIDGRPWIIDPVVGDHEWETRKRQSRRSGKAVSDPATAPDLSPFSPLSLIEAQRQLVLERTRKLQLERDVAEGRLVATADVAKEAFEAKRIVRETLLNLPPRVAALIAAETDPARVYSMLDAAIREALSTAADALDGEQDTEGRPA